MDKMLLKLNVSKNQFQYAKIIIKKVFSGNKNSIDLFHRISKLKNNNEMIIFYIYSNENLITIF